MDPEACLDRAERAIDDREWRDAREALADYQQWRDRGGFQPPGGDTRADGLRKRMVPIEAPDGWITTGTGGGCTAWQIDLPGDREALITDYYRAPEYDSSDLVIGLYSNVSDGAVLIDYHEGDLASCLAWFEANKERKD